MFPTIDVACQLVYTAKIKFLADGGKIFVAKMYADKHMYKIITSLRGKKPVELILNKRSDGT